MSPFIILDFLLGYIYTCITNNIAIFAHATFHKSHCSMAKCGSHVLYAMAIFNPVNYKRLNFKAILTLFMSILKLF